MPDVKFVDCLSNELIRECMTNGTTFICDARTTAVQGSARPIEEDFLIQMRQCFVEYFQIPQLARIANSQQIAQDLVDIFGKSDFQAVVIQPTLNTR